ncbi:hypothetical protein [Enterovibrio norvegicus]|uniref:hypothetical protein n=1 Tax=Enterovibrio norvegicus TaxID=188144 RepID=UPI00354D5642
MKTLSEILENGLSYKDEHSIDITRHLALTCKFNLVVDYEGGAPDAYTNHYFILENSEDKTKIIFKNATDIEPNLNVEFMDGDIIAVKIAKLLSKEEEENLSDREKSELIFLPLSETRKLIRAAKHLKWMSYYMYKGTEEILKSIDSKLK